MIFGNARLWTGSAFTPGALEVRGGVIHAVGAAGGGDVDLGGAWVLPGLIDAHFHLQQTGAALRTVQLAGARSEEEAARLVVEAAARLAPGAWVIGGGWDDNRWPSRRLPTRASVAEVAAPMVMTRVDFHAVWVNGAALEVAGIDRHTPDPPGGKILRDAQGSPTGVLIDTAADLVTRCIPRERTETLETDVRAALARCARVGLTCVHDMMMSVEVLEVLRRLEVAGELTLRVRAYMHGPAAVLEPELRRGRGDGLVQVMGTKLFADGALGSRGAALRAPYADDPSTSGLLMMSEAELTAAAAFTHGLGRQLAIHAIGDRAAELACAAIVAAQGASGARRHRIEHAQTVTPEMFDVFAKAGIIASMQPSHCTCDLGWAVRRLGPERVKGAYAWRSFLKAGARLALGSDAPIASENPWDGIRSAVARTDEHGATITPEERLTLAEALAGYTSGAAFAAHDDAALGALTAGRLADFVVVDRDPFALPAEQLAEVRTLRTVVGGVTVFAQDA